MFYFHHKPDFYKWPSQNIINFASSSPPCSKGVTAKDPLSCLNSPDLSASLCFPQKSAGWCLRKQVKLCNSQCILWHRRNSLTHGICLASSASGAEGHQQCHPALVIIVGQHSKCIIQRLPYSQGTFLLKIINKLKNPQAVLYFE